jgi:hypothetical protein
MTIKTIKFDGEPENMNGNGYTWREIQQQPTLWPTTAEPVREGIETPQVQAKPRSAISALVKFAEVLSSVAEAG